jgi:hypothetical protein
MSEEQAAAVQRLMSRAAQAISGARLEMARSPITAAERLQDAIDDAAAAKGLLCWDSAIGEPVCADTGWLPKECTCEACHARRQAVRAAA